MNHHKEGANWVEKFSLRMFCLRIAGSGFDFYRPALAHAQGVADQGNEYRRTSRFTTLHVRECRTNFQYAVRFRQQPGRNFYGFRSGAGFLSGAGISLMKSGFQIRRQIGKKLAFGPRKSSRREKEKTLGVHFLNFADTKRFLSLVSRWNEKRKKIELSFAKTSSAFSSNNLGKIEVNDAPAIVR